MNEKNAIAQIWIEVLIMNKFQSVFVITQNIQEKHLLNQEKIKKIIEKYNILNCAKFSIECVAFETSSLFAKILLKMLIFENSLYLTY